MIKLPDLFYVTIISFTLVGLLVFFLIRYFSCLREKKVARAIAIPPQTSAQEESEGKQATEENLSLHEELFQKNTQLSALLDITKSITESAGLNQILSRITESATQLLKGHSSSLRLLINKEDLIVVSGFNLSERVMNRGKVKLGLGISGLVAQKGGAISIEDVKTDDRVLNKSLLLQEGLRSLLSVPLKIREDVLGVLTIYDNKVKSFTQTEINLLSTFGNQAAIAIKNAQLFDDLARAKKEWENTFDAVSEAISINDLSCSIIRANKAMADLLKTTPQKLIGQKCHNLIYGLDQPCSNCKHMTSMESGNPIIIELEEQRLGGFFEFSFYPIILKEDIEPAIVHIIRDITQQRKVQEHIIQSEKLLALGEMASGVAHDFNNVLATILGNTQLLQFKVNTGGFSGELMDALKIIERAAIDGAETVRRIQEFTHLEIDRQLVQVDLNKIVQNAVELTKHRWKDQMEAQGIIVEVVTELQELPPVAGKESELREVLTNIIFNALDAMPGGGQIVIKTETDRDFIRVSVADTGIGMTEEIKRRIFDPFFTTKGVNGTGLGLSIAYGIIARHGGEISVRSRLGEGSSFTLRLPIRYEVEHKVASDDNILVSQNTPEKCRILVIDDELEVREILAQILTEAGGHQVTVAQDGYEGLEAFRNGTFDVVFTDLGMPGMTGWEVTDKIKEINSQIPIILVTGWGVKLDEERLKASKVDLVIAKPFRLEQILKIIKEALSLKSLTRTSRNQNANNGLCL